jgi:hypothetical protein
MVECKNLTADNTKQTWVLEEVGSLREKREFRHTADSIIRINFRMTQDYNQTH